MQNPQSLSLTSYVEEKQQTKTEQFLFALADGFTTTPNHFGNFLLQSGLCMDNINSIMRFAFEIEPLVQTDRFFSSNPIMCVHLPASGNVVRGSYTNSKLMTELKGPPSSIVSTSRALARELTSFCPSKPVSILVGSGLMLKDIDPFPYVARSVSDLWEIVFHSFRELTLKSFLRLRGYSSSVLADAMYDVSSCVAIHDLIMEYRAFDISDLRDRDFATVRKIDDKRCIHHSGYEVKKCDRGYYSDCICIYVVSVNISDMFLDLMPSLKRSLSYINRFSNVRVYTGGVLLFR